MLVKLWRNPETVGRIYLQACHLLPEGLLADQKDRFFSHAFAAMHKLSAVEYHLDNYRRIELEQLKQAERRLRDNPDDVEEAFELIFELEAFLVQVKSSLDMLVKLLRPVLGEGVVRTKTFSKKGEALVKGLAQHRKKAGVNVLVVDALIRLIETHQQRWLNRIVSLRDHLTHVEALRNYRFLPVSDPADAVGVQKPRFADMDTLPLMELVRSNNLIFHQEFMTLSLALRAFPELFLVREDPEEMKKIFQVESAKYVVWGWRFEVPNEFKLPSASATL